MLAVLQEDTNGLALEWIGNMQGCNVDRTGLHGILLYRGCLRSKRLSAGR